MTAAAGSPSAPASPSRAFSREALSALADGEMQASEVAAACRGCTGDAQAMADWHAWHLIGDVLRSDDLATAAGHDANFLAELRVRLAQEPVVLAPVLAPSPPTADALTAQQRGSVWGRFGVVPSAMAAGFALVAVGLIGVRLTSPATVPVASYANAGPSDGVSAGPSNTRPDAVGTTLTAAQTPVQHPHVERPVAAEPQVMVANSKLVRDARLDRYLAAHQQFAGDTALTVPTAFLRNATVDAPR